MCYKGKCLYFLEVETGALIFAILNVMFTSLGSLLSVGGLVYINLIMEVSIENAETSDYHKIILAGLGASGLLAMLLVSYSIAFAFAVVLIVGICKRKANLVKIYFVYGMVKTVLAVAAIIASSINSFQFLVQLLFLVYSIYAPILYMIYVTSVKFEQKIAPTEFSNPISTIEKF